MVVGSIERVQNSSSNRSEGMTVWTEGVQAVLKLVVPN